MKTSNKKNTVKIKINQLLKTMDKEALAKKLNVSTRYIYYLGKGRSCGWHLYKEICRLYDQKNKEKNNG